MNILLCLIINFGLFDFFSVNSKNEGKKVLLHFMLEKMFKQEMYEKMSV